MKDWNDAHRAGGDARQAGDNAETYTPKKLILSSGQFVAGYVAPQYLIDGVLQQRRVYSLTGKTGDGKTALQLFLCYALATQHNLGTREVEECRTLYLAGENPDDVRARWLAMSDALGFDAETIGVHFVPGVFKVSEMLELVKNEVTGIGGVGAVVVDTSAAYFEGDEENNNVQFGNHARLLRQLCDLPGNPAVIIGCHPTKSGEALIPRGGGAFLAEVDGNLTVQKTAENVIELHWSGKLRGQTFEPMLFELTGITSNKVIDAKGRLIPTVMVKLIDDAKAAEIADEARSDWNQLIILLDTTPGMSQANIARALLWFDKHGEPLKSRVSRALKKLDQHKLAKKDLDDKYALTEKGKAEAKKLRNEP
jgi:hypothetical protein